VSPRHGQPDARRKIGSTKGVGVTASKQIVLAVGAVDEYEKVPVAVT